MYGDKQNYVKCPVIKKGTLDDAYKIQPLPLPTGKYPYHLDFTLKENSESSFLSFNMVGDTGGIKSPQFQQQIAEQMGLQTKDQLFPTQFLYHLGDIVYHFGEKEQYEKQFFKPYSSFPAPIYAIAGNHDADVNYANPLPYKSLNAFMSVFCDTRSGAYCFSDNVTRKNQKQPHVYWTLNTAQATIIGLYGNVPKFGYIDEEQQEWFVNELIRAGAMQKEKAIIVCLHHAPYTADTNHGSSLAMIKALEDSYEKAGVLPDIVFSGHVHNYQRFSKQYANGKIVPYIVAGSGGFDELHVLATTDDSQFSTDNEYFHGVTLENYSLRQHGFMKVIVKKENGQFTLTCEYYTMVHELQTPPAPAQLYDTITLNLKRDTN